MVVVMVLLVMVAHLVVLVVRVVHDVGVVQVPGEVVHQVRLLVVRDPGGEPAPGVPGGRTLPALPPAATAAAAPPTGSPLAHPGGVAKVPVRQVGQDLAPASGLLLLVGRLLLLGLRVDAEGVLIDQLGAGVEVVEVDADRAHVLRVGDAAGRGRLKQRVIAGREGGGLNLVHGCTITRAWGKIIKYVSKAKDF